MEEKIITLQETVAHQAMEIKQLSEELYLQQKEMAELRGHIDMLAAKMQAADGNNTTDTMGTPEPPPPHY